MPAIRGHVLSVQDNEVDSQLLEEIWGRDPEIKLTVLTTGTLAMNRLKTIAGRIPNLILLAGRFPFTQMATLDVLVALKADQQLKCIPVVVIAGVESSETIQLFYNHYAAAVIVFPSTLEELEATLAVMKTFWLSVARLPGETNVFYEGWE